MDRAPRAHLSPRSALRRLGGFSLAAGIALLAAPAAAEIEEITLGPVAPTWDDAVTITVEGTVVTSCGPDIVHLGEPELLFEPGTGQVVDAALSYDDCPVLAPPVTYDFTVTAQAPPLVPGLYTVRVRDPAFGEEETVPLTVHDVSPFDLVLPTAATDGAPAVIGFRGWASCPDLEVLAEGEVLELDYSGECQVLPPGPVVFHIEEPVGPLSPGDYEVVVYDHDHVLGGADAIPAVAKGSFRVWNAEECVPSDTELCLQDGRFRVAVTWKDFEGGTGVGHPIPVRDDSGLFWFFRDDNVELTVKVLNGCPINGHWWTFVSGGSTVEYEIIVTDTRNDVGRTYENASGETPELIADVLAFGTCP